MVLLKHLLIDHLLTTHKQYKETILNLIMNEMKINGHKLHVRVKYEVRA